MNNTVLQKDSVTLLFSQEDINVLQRLLFAEQDKRSADGTRNGCETTSVELKVSTTSRGQLVHIPGVDF